MVSQGMTTYVAGAKGVVQCAQVRSNYFVPSDGGLLLSKTKMRVLFVSLTPFPDPQRFGTLLPSR